MWNCFSYFLQYNNLYVCLFPETIVAGKGKNIDQALKIPIFQSQKIQDDQNSC